MKSISNQSISLNAQHTLSQKLVKAETGLSDSHTPEFHRIESTPQINIQQEQTNNMKDTGIN